jgi:hypothetical protein
MLLRFQGTTRILNDKALLPWPDADFFLLVGRVLINPTRGSDQAGLMSDVRYAPESGAKADIAGLPR